MREDDLRPSENVEDRRGESGGFGGLGGGGLGIGAIVALGLLGWALGIDPRLLISGAEKVAGTRAPAHQESTGPRGAPQDQMGQFVARVLGETEDVWAQLLPAQAGRPYQPPVLVLFSGATGSACGLAQSAAGPFYCPPDRKVYLDTAFFQDMQRRLGGGGAFAYAYVIAHEVGHHVENLLGLLSRAQEAQRAAPNQAAANRLSVRIELMADCLAGVWANRMNQRHQNIDEADVRQAVATATAIGDDRLQRHAQGTVVPDSFTHGSSEQRVHWLMTGLRSGSVQACDTFQGQPL